MVAGWNTVGKRRCADLHRGEDGAGGDEAREKLATRALDEEVFDPEHHAYIYTEAG
jgi:hypothetical protein